jgi:hypothetical protein
MMLGRRSEIPQNRFVVLGKEGEAIRFVLRPGADVSGGDIADIIHVEAEHGAHLGFLEKSFGAGEALPAQAIEVDTILPINRH